MDLSKLSTKGLEILQKNKGNLKASLAELPDDDLYLLQDQISKSQPQNVPEQSTGEKIGRGVLATIPAVTGLAGGLIGSGLGPAGSVGGASLGYAGGRQIENLLKAGIFGERPQSRGELYGGMAQDIVTGAGAEVGGQVVAKGLGALGKGVGRAGEGIKKAYEYTKATPKSNVEEILKAGEQTGITPTRGMLTENKLVGQLESGLSQSGSIPAMEVRAQQDLLRNQVSAATEKLSSKASQKTAYETGDVAKQYIENVVETNKAPVTELYEKLEPDFLEIPIDLKTVNREIGVLKRDVMFKNKYGREFLDQVVEDISGLSNLADLKQYRTNFKKSLPRDASDYDRMMVDAIYGKLTDIRNNSIAALQNHPEFKFAPGGASKELAQTVDEIALADAAHATNMKSLNGIRHIFGQKEPFKSSSDFIKKVSEIPNQNLTEKVFSSGNVNEIKTFADQFPEAFGQMKIQKVSTMIQNSMDQSGFNFNKFNKTYEKLDPNIRDIIFDAETKSYIGALKTVFENLPERLGPSGTPQGIMTMDAIMPDRIISDMWSKYVYKNSTPQGAMILKSIGQGATNIGESLQKPFGALPTLTRSIPMVSGAIERRKQTLNQGEK